MINELFYFKNPMYLHLDTTVYILYFLPFYVLFIAYLVIIIIIKYDINKHIEYIKHVLRICKLCFNLGRLFLPAKVDTAAEINKNVLQELKKLTGIKHNLDYLWRGSITIKNSEGFGNIHSLTWRAYNETVIYKICTILGCIAVGMHLFNMPIESPFLYYFLRSFSFLYLILGILYRLIQIISLHNMYNSPFMAENKVFKIFDSAKLSRTQKLFFCFGLEFGFLLDVIPAYSRLALRFFLFMIFLSPFD